MNSTFPQRILRLNDCIRLFRCIKYFIPVCEMALQIIRDGWRCRSNLLSLKSYISWSVLTMPPSSTTLASPRSGTKWVRRVYYWNIFEVAYCNISFGMRLCLACKYCLSTLLIMAFEYAWRNMHPVISIISWQSIRSRHDGIKLLLLMIWNTIYLYSIYKIKWFVTQSILQRYLFCVSCE